MKYQINFDTATVTEVKCCQYDTEIEALGMMTEILLQKFIRDEIGEERMLVPEKSRAQLLSALDSMRSAVVAAQAAHGDVGINSPRVRSSK